VAHRNLDLKLFEIGKAYHPPDADGNWVEEDRLSMAISGDTMRSWRETPRPADFYDLTGGLERLLSHFNITGLELAATESPYLDSTQSFELRLDGAAFGTVGLVQAAKARKFDIKQPVYVLQLSLDPIFKRSQKLTEFCPLPVYPAVTRDIAMVVGETVRVGQLIDLIKSTAGDLAEDVNIFDLYTGKQIGAGEKSVAIAIRFRSSERSLSNAEIDDLQEKIVSKLKDNFKAEIRDS
jgi:phenylalanyl-tRNA synthetase beta chain